MHIIVGSDHAGFALKEQIKVKLQTQGHTVEDAGCHSTDSCDYPDFGYAVGKRVAAGAGMGIVVCGSGIGISIAANKVPGVRAALCTSAELARLAREHNDANVLALGARNTAPELAHEMVAVFLATPFAGGRHERRTAKLNAGAGQ